MPRAIQDSVVVLTGASSGIGRATAVEFARRGATLVLAARRRVPLEEVANACERLGGRALVVPTDVTDEAAVEALAEEAERTFGRIDVWVNNAAVTMFAPFEEAPANAYRRVIETNLFGYVHGARAALPRFREQGSGILVNNASVVGKVPEPMTSAYVASKHAIVGLSGCLRLETMGTDIHVCTVLPASIDTPIFQHAANYTGRPIKPLEPVYAAEKVAHTIVGLAEAPRRETIAGNAGRMVVLFHTLMPGLFERKMSEAGVKGHIQDDRYVEPTEGNVFEPMAQWTSVSGNWRERPARGRAMAAGATALGLVLVGLRRMRRGTH